MQKNVEYIYQAFGLNINSAIPIKYLEYARYKKSGVCIDVYISLGNAPKTIDKSFLVDKWMVASASEMLLKIDNIANYHVKDGKYIIVEPKCDLSNPNIYVYIIGSCLGAILRQRNILALHSGCVYNGDYGVLFMGYSGAGKSTVTGEFIRRGWHLVTDDIAPITIEGRSGYVQSGIPMQRLWEDSIVTLDISEDKVDAVWYNGFSKIKYTCNAKGVFYNGQVLLKHVILLGKHNEDSISISSIEGKNKIPYLINNIYRPGLYNGKAGIAEKFTSCVELASRIEMWNVVRPENASVSEIVASISHNVLSREKCGVLHD